MNRMMTGLLTVTTILLLSCGSDSDNDTQPQSQSSQSTPPPVVEVPSFPNDQPFFVNNGPVISSEKKWVAVENMTDEFEGDVLDVTKWHADPKGNGWGWIGRPPGLFEAENVSVSDGKLNVTTLKFASPKVINGNTFTHGGGIVRSINSGGQGMYYECRMKANKTIMSSTFWLSFKENCPRKLELDIQECVGRVHDGTAAWAKKWDAIYHSNAILHKRDFCGQNEELRDQGQKLLEEKNHERYFVYGCWWKSPKEVLIYLDGEFAYRIDPPTDFDLEGYLTMAIETYNWNPVDEAGSIFETATFDDLTTKYDWIRTWKLEDK